MPQKLSADFGCAMEDVLDVYRRPYDDKRPVIAMDEVPKQLVAELRLPGAARLGKMRWGQPCAFWSGLCKTTRGPLT